MIKKETPYMIFMFGDFEEEENIVTNLSSQLFSVVSSNFLKFTYGEYGVVFHFRSNETFSDLKEYIDMALLDIVSQYFLMEVTSKIDIKMEKKLKKDFLNIDGDKKTTSTKNGGINIEELNKKNKEDTKKFTFDLFFPIFDTDQKEKFIENKIPTVDEILEKITEKGIESLTKEEKQILDNYAKRQDRRN